MVASSNHEQYSPFPRGVIPFELEGCQSSEEESELHSPFFDQPLADFLPTEPRYQSIAPASILPPDSLIAPPHNSQHFAQSQGFGAHLDEYPKEPPNTAMTYNTSVQLRTQSFTSSAYELAMPHFPSLMNPAFNRYSNSVDAPPSTQITPSTSQFNLSHPSSSTASAPIPRPPLASPLVLDTMEPPKPVAPHGFPDASGAPSSPRPGPTRNVPSGVIACRQCRSRKIRCDSTRPKCQNCLKRGNDCAYDKVPKRRGPDKRPGTRKRSCKKRQSDGSEPNQPKKQRRGDPFDEDTSTRADCKQDEISPMTLPVFVPAHHKVNKPKTDPPAQASSFVVGTPSFPDGYYVKRQPSPSPAKIASTSQHTLKSEVSPELPLSHPFESDLRTPETPSYDDPSPPPADDPIVNYARNSWWDELLDAYAPTREQAFKDISNDLKVLSTSSGHWLTFFNVDWFLPNLMDSRIRAHMQPALVYAYLAMAKFVRSSEIELGVCGRLQALKLRDVAKTHLQESWNKQWIDLGLAEAAMVLALFETSAHPQHNDASADAALLLLDEIIQTLQLTVLDARDHDTLDHSTGVPTVAHGHTLKRCECTAAPADNTSSWSFQPAWDPLWSADEVRAEETRRLCWSALVLVANHTVARAAEQREPLCLFLIESSNFQLLFPGEYHQRGEYGPAAAQSGKDSVWALYCRSMLLWNCTVRFWDERLSTEDRTRVACAAFVETRVVEEALDAHVCNIDTALIYMCREFISNTRLEVTYLTQRLLLDLDVRAKPVWNRRLAEEWLFYQEQVAKRVKNSLLLTRHGAGDRVSTAPVNTTSPTAAHIFLRRPFEIGWFTNQVETCLALWEGDRDLLHALELAKTFLAPTEVLNALWPCAAFHARGKALRVQLSQACANSGIPPPPPSRALHLLPSLAPLPPSSASSSASSSNHMMGSSRS
ncbi:hypothetical protein EDB85DRAFT_1895962 [Lactarius pseudohatsudake]|nr:hypothetical protein EDB85DRAFT_1895962 [Lactarius pseudohatsudake]